MKQAKKLPRYQHNVIEKKWQQKWAEERIYEYQPDSTKESYYTLVELPYPSGDLHLGHWFTFSNADILARTMRMLGKHVFFTNGFDAFGLPAENAAIKRGIHPKDWTLTNIASMKKQFASMGSMIDPTHETITCLPEYYQWNQWIFLKLYEKGLAYQGKALGNWCPKDMTVLANEHVENGKCWRCGTEVIQKEVEQWFIRLTDYADQLIWPENPTVDWPKSVREGQNNWIGKKEGMKIKHKVVGMSVEFETFTAFPAWSWADTYIVIAPEHPLVQELIQGTKYEKSVNDCIAECAKITNDERIADNFEKKGAFTGRYAKDPFGGEDMPIWVANFALMNFGTGIIRCSGHDPRDFAFATKYQIPIKEVVDRTNPDEPVNAHTNQGTLKNSGPFSGREVGKVIEEVKDWIEQQGIGKRFSNYHIHDWSISRQRYWGTPVPMVHCDHCGTVPVPEKDLPVELPYDVDFAPTGKPPLATATKWMQVKCPKCGKDAKRDPETLDTFFDSSWYYYRYLDPKYPDEPFSKELAKRMMPVDIYFGGAEHTLGHTLYARFFTKFFKSLGLVHFDEFAKKRVQHGVILGPDGNRMSKSKGNVVNPDEVVKEYGADTVRLYLAFMMPFDATAPWNPKGIWGVYRLLKRIWDIAGEITDSKMTPEDLRQMHKTIKKVSDDIIATKFNTAVSSLMIWVNYLSAKKEITTEEYKNLLLLLAPFAPHMTEEIWQIFYGSDKEFMSVHTHTFPLFDEALVREDTLAIVIQENGKVKDTLLISASEKDNKEDIIARAKSQEKVMKTLAGKQIAKTIYISGKIINFVTQ